MKVLDLFSGIGGFSLGLERAGMQTVAFCEPNKFCQAVLHKHWPDVPIYEDVRDLSATRLANDGIQFDVICGGFPCQDISVAGKGAGLAGERSGLWWEYHRLIEETKPSWVIAENVSALRSRGLDDVLRSLTEIGYDAEWHCIPASAVGAPHQRDRIWIVAYPNSRTEAIRGQRSDFSEQGFVWRDQRKRSDSDARQKSIQGTRYVTGNLAYSAQLQCDGSNDYTGISLEGESVSKLGNGGWSADVADTNGTRWQRSQETRNDAEVWTQSTNQLITGCGGVSGRNWEIEPSVGRVANGVPNRLDRLKALGNAVVPQIPELIGRWIYEQSSHK